jgi:hypothetical protein
MVSGISMAIFMDQIIPMYKKQAIWGNNPKVLLASCAEIK